MKATARTPCAWLLSVAPCAVLTKVCWSGFRRPNFMQAYVFLTLLLLASGPAFGQSTNQITAVSPPSAAQGTNGLTLTFTLDTDSPPAPPADAPLPSVTVGTLTGSAVTHSSQFTVTAQFSILPSEPVGWKDAAIVFSTPNGALTFSKTKAFQVTAASGAPVAGFTATPTYGMSPLTVSFTDASSGTITNRLWDFGDSTAGTNANPAHTYTNVATYTVSLTVFGPSGTNKLTRANYIALTTNLAASVIVDTGQTNFYNNTGIITAPSPGQPFYGQDAQFSGNQPSYMLSDDGKTVYDNNTGLTWMRGPNTNLASPVRSDKMTLGAATNWPATLNAANYGGYSDWRLPTIKELYSLFDCRGTDPSSYSGSDTSVLTPFIDTSYFNFAWGQTSLGERLIDSQYASSTVFVLNPAETGYPKLFGVNFADGRIKGYDLIMPDGTTEKTFFVQLVRGGTGYGVNSFTNNGDGTITDRSTGLMWSRADNGSGLLWSNALAWVQTNNAANYLGHHDWRMPNIKELQSLVNYANAPDHNGLPAIDTDYFLCTSITNEAGQLDFPYYWSSSTHGSYTTNNTGGGQADYIPFGRALGWPSGQTNWVDVHGAGCQRSDPKTGPPYSFPATNYYVTNNGVIYSGYSFGPQGDAIRSFNYLRLVRDAGTAPAAGFSAAPTNGGAPLAVTLTDTSTGTITNRFWSFGDGAITNTAATNLIHTYQFPGTNTVTLVAAGPLGLSTNTQTNLIVVTSVDTLGDGIPDWWRAQYFGGDGKTTNVFSCTTCDPDGDGAVNYSEYIADTNPTNALSYFHIQSASNSNALAVFFASSASRKYTLYYASDLIAGVWTNRPAQTDIPGSGGVDALTDQSPTGAQRFYCIGVSLP